MLPGITFQGFLVDLKWRYTNLPRQALHVGVYGLPHTQTLGEGPGYETTWMVLHDTWSLGVWSMRDEILVHVLTPKQPPMYDRLTTCQL